MNDLASADVDRYMTGVTDQIVNFRFTVADALPTPACAPEVLGREIPNLAYTLW